MSYHHPLAEIRATPGVVSVNDALGFPTGADLPLRSLLGKLRTPLTGVGLAYLLAEYGSDIWNALTVRREFVDFSDDEWAFLIDDGFINEIGDEVPLIPDEEPLRQDVVSPKQTANRAVKIQSNPLDIGTSVPGGSTVAISIAPPRTVSERKVIFPPAVTSQVSSIPAEFPAGTRYPPVAGAVDAVIPAPKVPTRARPVTLPRATQDIPDIRVSFGPGKLAGRDISGIRTLELTRVDKTSERTATAVRSLQQDQKPKGGLMYVAANRFISRTFGVGTELLDFFQALKANIWLLPLPGDPFVFWPESAREKGYQYSVTVRSPQRLSELPFNAQDIVLWEIASGRLTRYALDWEGLAASLYNNELGDVSIGVMARAERFALQGSRLGRYGNISTWVNRVRRNLQPPGE